jgi:hypothetical protein
MKEDHFPVRSLKLLKGGIHCVPPAMLSSSKSTVTDILTSGHHVGEHQPLEPLPRLGFDRTCKFDEMIEARRSGDAIGEHPCWRNHQNQPAPLLPKYRVSDLNKRP